MTRRKMVLPLHVELALREKKRNPHLSKRALAYLDSIEYQPQRRPLQRRKLKSLPGQLSLFEDFPVS